jgi:hypothetical protein
MVLTATCDTSQIFHNGTFGVPNYATMKVVQSSAFSEVRFSEYSSNRFAVSLARQPLASTRL